MQTLWSNKEHWSYFFFQCVVAQYCWCVLRDTLEWESAPTSVNEMHEKMIGDFNLPIRDFIFLFGSLAWSLWLIRNDLVFPNIVALSTNIVGLFRLISFMQKWKILNKEKGQLWIDSVTLKLRHRLSLLQSDGLMAESWACVLVVPLFPKTLALLCFLSGSF